MSSVARTYATRKEAITQFVKPMSPSYRNNNGVIVLFPFSYRDGVLDITYAGNNFQSAMVDITGNRPNDETVTVVSIMGGSYLATSLGDNFKDYIRAWRDETIDLNSPITVYTPAQLLRVQEANLKNIGAGSGASFRVTTQPPASDTLPDGDTLTHYNTTYIFKTPLIFTIMESGVKQYITFMTTLDQE